MEKFLLILHVVDGFYIINQIENIYEKFYVYNISKKLWI